MVDYIGIDYMGGSGIVSVAAGVKILLVTSAISLNDVQGMFITLTYIRVLLVLCGHFIVESTKEAFLVLCSKSLPIGNIVTGSFA